LIKRPELTSIRGLCALWVMALHINIILLPFTYIPIISAGYIGVGVFFILSIYLLLQSLDENSDLKHYFIRRIRRIWPMYFITVIIVFFYFGHNITWLAENVTFTNVFINYTTNGYVFWSLQVEEVAYIFFPLIHRMTNKNKLYLGYYLFIMSFVSIAILELSNISYVLLNYWWVPLTLASYGLGILVYLKKVPKALIVFGILIFLYVPSTQYGIISPVVLPAFALLIQYSDKIEFLKSRLLVKIGDISYGIYLIHYILILQFGWFSTIIVLPLSYLFEKLNKVINKVI
jgi:peptidoglycan/LPS O-acetylase OafA/YrhL